MQDQKSTFIKNEMFALVSDLPAGSKGNWGKMNAQQMLEHVADFFDVAAGNIKFDLVTPVAHLPKYMEFLLSDKAFRENTKAPETVLGEDPLPIRTANMEAARNKLMNAVTDFYKHFENDPVKTTLHPVFGPLNLDQWILLHYKHVTHHLRQFGLIQPV